MSDNSGDIFLLPVRSPALRSPRSGTPRRHLITPVPGDLDHFLYFSKKKKKEKKHISLFVKLDHL